MRKAAWILTLILVSTPLMAQVSNPSIIVVSTAPSGSCANGLPNQQVLSTGAQYTCQGGTWGIIPISTSLANGTTATTQIPIDMSAKVATDLFVATTAARAKSTAILTLSSGGGIYSASTAGSGAVINWTATAGVITSIGTIYNGASGYNVGDVVTPAGGNYDAYLAVTSVSGTAITGLVILNGGTGYSSGTNTTVYPPLLLPTTITINGSLTSNAVIALAPGTAITTSTVLVINNNTTGGYTVTVKLGNGAGGSIGTGVVVPSGTSNSTATWVETDGVTDVWNVSSPLSGTMTYTAATSDTLTMNGVTASSHCTFSPTNSTAAATTVLGYVSSVSANSVTISHVATTASGGTVNIICTAH